MNIPGKFESNENQQLGEYLHGLSLDGCLDRELGDVQDFGWYGLLLSVMGMGKMKSYIISEDNQGFFDYTQYDSQDLALDAWSKIESDYEDFTNESENNI